MLSRRLNIEISCDSRRLLETDRGLVVEVVFRGRYLLGSEGNPQAYQMKAFTSEVVSREHPIAVLFNMTDLRYQWGDAIGSIAFPLLNVGTNSFKPACVVAKGRTARALEWFFTDRAIFGIAGFKLFSDSEQALRFLKNRIALGTA